MLTKFNDENYIVHFELMPIISPTLQAEVVEKAIEAKDLPENYKPNLYFSLNVHKELDKLLPDLGKHSVFYIGSGGDFISAWLATGADEIFMMDKTPFLVKSAGMGRDTNMQYEDFDEVWEEASKIKGTINAGNLTYHEKVRPALQIAISLQQLGIKRDDVQYNAKDESATLTVDLQAVGIPNTLALHYVNEEVSSASQITEKQVSGKNFGLFTKGGTGEITVRIVNDFPQNKKPSYLIADDLEPRLIEEIPAVNRADIKNTGFSPVGWGWQEKNIDKDYLDIAHIFTL